MFKFTDYGSVDNVNIYSKIDIRISTKNSMEELVNEENDKQILNTAIEVDSIIIAWERIE